MAYRYPYDDEVKTIATPKLETNRSIWKFMILNILTLGIYSIVVFISFSFDLDKAAPKRDHTKTTNFLLAYVFSLFTVSIVLVVSTMLLSAVITSSAADFDTFL